MKNDKREINFEISIYLKMSKNNKKLFSNRALLDYVGLPILLNLANKYFSYGYDINLERINNLRKGIDTFNEYKKRF